MKLHYDSPAVQDWSSSQRTFTFGSMDRNCSRTSAIGSLNLYAFSCFFFDPAFKRFFFLVGCCGVEPLYLRVCCPLH
jgi:hypothetical protein